MLLNIILVFVCISCNFFSARPTESNEVSVERTHIDIEKLSKAIEVEFVSVPDSVTEMDMWLRYVYGNRKFTPFWFCSTNETAAIDSLLSVVSKVENHGISPARFNFDWLSKENQHYKKNEMSYFRMAIFDIGLTAAYLHYCFGMKFGFVNPTMACTGYHFAVQTPDSAFVDSCVSVKAPMILHYLRNLEPVSSAYNALRSERQKYALYTDSVFAPIPYLLDAKKTIKLGQVHSSIPLVARRMMITGELPYGFDYENSMVFDLKLLNALNVFRLKTGLLLDEEIGNKTIDALNMSFSGYVQKIDLNLERMRWKTKNSLGRKYVYVNVADMSLIAYRNDTAVLRMKVCVGKPPQNKTPFLQSRIYELVLNPTWTVPNSIVIKEISKIAMKDSTYLERQKIRIFAKNVEIKPKEANWSAISTFYQPYVLIQDSGSINALGRIKFNFWNPFSVYLHDTNSKSSFARHNRAISHGCVRVEKPLELACFCLSDVDVSDKKQQEKNDLLKDKIRHSIGLKVLSKVGKEWLSKDTEGLKMSKVRLNQYIPIVIDYRTCFVNPAGLFQFKEDIYEQDSVLYNRLSELKLYRTTH